MKNLNFLNVAIESLNTTYEQKITNFVVKFAKKYGKKKAFWTVKELANETMTTSRQVILWAKRNEKFIKYYKSNYEKTGAGSFGKSQPHMTGLGGYSEPMIFVK